MSGESISLVRQLIAQWHQPSEVEASELDVPPEGFPLLDSTDQEIILHREIHFGGSFSAMLEYYEREGKGALLDTDRIYALADFEQKMGQNLATVYLTEIELGTVASILTVYERLRSLCETQAKPTRARLIAELILAEEEEEEAAIAAVVQTGAPIVPELIRLLEAVEFSGPLAPGYGFAPVLAARCLGQIGDPLAVRPLFEAIGHPNEEIDHGAIAALAAIGEPAQGFLLRVLQARPFSIDTERAAAALSTLPSNPLIGQQALELLHDTTLWKPHPNLMAYLAICCGGLSTQEQRDRLATLIKDPRFPGLAREEAEYWLSHPPENR